MGRVRLYVGTYGRSAPYLGETNGEGIYWFDVDRAQGTIVAKGNLPGVDNPSYLALSPDDGHLYSINEVWGWPEGDVCAFAIAVDGSLSYVNRQPTRGSINAQLTVDRSGRWVLLTNFWEGPSVVVFEIGPEGGVLPASAWQRHEGVDDAGVDRSHAHCVVLSPDNARAYVADLGMDRVYQYDFNAANGSLNPSATPFIELDPGSGPRHLVFHPSGEFLYVVQEKSSRVTVLSVDAADGSLKPVQSVSALPSDYDGPESHCAAIQIAPDGQHLYVSNRGRDSIAAFSVDGQGLLSPVGHTPSGGRTPRDFVIEPEGAWLIAANQDSENLVLFDIDASSGALIPTGIEIPVPTPSCVKAISIP